MFFHMCALHGVEPPPKEADRGRDQERACHVPVAKLPQAVEYIPDVMVVDKRRRAIHAGVAKVK